MIADVYSAENVSHIVNLKEINRQQRDFAVIYPVWVNLKEINRQQRDFAVTYPVCNMNSILCYSSENRAMSL